MPGLLLILHSVILSLLFSLNFELKVFWNLFILNVEWFRASSVDHFLVDLLHMHMPSCDL